MKSMRRQRFILFLFAISTQNSALGSPFVIKECGTYELTGYLDYKSDEPSKLMLNRGTRSESMVPIRDVNDEWRQYDQGLIKVRVSIQRMYKGQVIRATSSDRRPARVAPSARILPSKLIKSAKCQSAE